MNPLPKRRVVWFSCGAASAVVAKVATDTYSDVEVVYCDTMGDEHPDNQRFFDDVQDWIGQEIKVIRSATYRSVDEVIAARHYLAGIAGAPCTVEMKKLPRFAYQRADDINLFGFTADEHRRVSRFEENNPDLLVEHILVDRSITKADCLEVLRTAGIALPAMYLLGYDHNNCLGCVKASSPRYWNAIRRDFPEVWERRVAQSREFGARLAQVGGKHVFIDDLPPDLMVDNGEDLSCGPECGGVSQLSMLAATIVGGGV